MNLRWRKDKDKPRATVYDCVGQRGAVVAQLRSGVGLNWNKGGEIDIEISPGDPM